LTYGGGGCHARPRDFRYSRRQIAEAMFEAMKPAMYKYGLILDGPTDA